MQIFELNEDEILTLMEALSRADLNKQSVKVAFDSGLKVKIGGGMWFAPMGVEA